MPRFFFHLRRGDELIPDEQGEELPDVETAYLQAFAAAQELWAMALSRRDDPTAYAFEVVSETGDFLFAFPLTEVLEASRKSPTHVTPSELHALLEKNRSLRESLLEQIEQTRSTLDRTYNLLRNLREQK